MENIEQKKEIDWASLKITDEDLEETYNLLLEKEIPMTPLEISMQIIKSRIDFFKKDAVKETKNEVKVYRPKDSYKPGDEIIFSHLNNAKGIVTAIRNGLNPDEQQFKVITVKFEDDSIKQYASELKNHKINDEPIGSTDQMNNCDPGFVYKKYGISIAQKVTSTLEKNEELICISGHWFPKALVLDINPGYLNLAEAVLEMEEGRPIPTSEILKQIEYPTDSNQKLTEFSFNYAMDHDERFDEVGPCGKILWVLQQMEPEDVRKRPLTLKYFPLTMESTEKTDALIDELDFYDELDPEALEIPDDIHDEAELSINYPHWKAGTLPLLGSIRSIFPTALETNSVYFSFHDVNADIDFPGWVIISENYICGLKNWYRTNNVIPGSFIHISQSNIDGQVNINLIPPKSHKDWILTALFNQEEHITFETRQQNINSKSHDYMSIYVENCPELDSTWETFNKEKVNIRKVIDYVFQDLSKQNPQRIVHFQQFYAAFNMLRRCPPKPLFYTLLKDNDYILLNDFYFKKNINDNSGDQN